MNQNLREYLDSLPDGGQQAFANRVQVSKSMMSQMANGHAPIPPARVIEIAAAADYKITPHQLRPDLYPHPEDGLPPELRAQAAA